MFELRGPENTMSPVRALSGYLLSPRRSCDMPRPSSIQLQHFVPELGRAFGQPRALFDHEPRLARSCGKPPGAERSPRAAHAQAARDQPLRRSRSGSTKTGSHNSTSTSPPRNNERRKSSASIEQLGLALRRQSLHNCRKQSVSVYIRAIRD